jgi:hypothetical protein
MQFNYTHKQQQQHQHQQQEVTTPKVQTNKYDLQNIYLLLSYQAWQELKKIESLAHTHLHRSCSILLLLLANWVTWVSFVFEECFF